MTTNPMELREIQQQTLANPVSSPTNSMSHVKLDELSSFGATKQSRLPALIKMNEDSKQPNSVPTNAIQEADKTEKLDKNLSASLPVDGKENKGPIDISDDFHMVDVTGDESVMVGPSLPQPAQESTEEAPRKASGNAAAALANSLQFAQDGQPSHLGDSLIDMIINLRNDNQNLVKALETNNEYVKLRLGEFKKLQEEAKQREAQFALDKAEHEHEVRKLKRQNQVLSDRLKSMEAKLRDMKLEVSDSLAAAHSSKASSVREQQAVDMNLSSSSSDEDEDVVYPQLESQSFGNPALEAENQQQQVTMRMDSVDTHKAPNAPQMETDEQNEAAKVAHGEFFAIDDPMKQCDRLEQQLDEIGKRDYEICLLQQQLNILRQDFRLERLAKIDAKIQVAKLKNDIDRLCLDRKSRKEASTSEQRSSSRRKSGVRFDAAAAAADAALSKLGQQLGKRATRQALKAAKYAAKQAHREEKAAAKAAASAAATAAYHASKGAMSQEASAPHHGRRHQRGRHGGSGSGAVDQLRAVKNEVVSDLLSTANKAVLTGYKMASTHVNLALDKLTALEKEQAAKKLG